MEIQPIESLFWIKVEGRVNDVVAHTHWRQHTHPAVYISQSVIIHCNVGAIEISLIDSQIQSSVITTSGLYFTSSQIQSSVITTSGLYFTSLTVCLR